MPENMRTCPLCGSPDSSFMEERRFRGESVRYRVCDRCGLVYQSPRMTAEELDRFYEHEYRAVYQGEEGPTAKDIRVQQGRSDHIAAFLSGRVREVDRFLDIGCSTGVLLEMVRDRFGCRVAGVEPGEVYRQYAAQKGLDLYPSLEALSQAHAERFDLVSLMHVLEHLPDPVSYLAGLREEHLAENGRLLIEVPNLYGHDSYEIAHLTAFSIHTLEQVLGQAGLRMEKRRAHGQPRSGILPLYLTVLARPDPAPSGKPIRAERWVPQKRKMAMLRRRVLERLVPAAAWRPIFPGKEGD